MKKFFTILCAGLITLGLSAQTDAGSIYIGVNSNGSFETYKADGADEGSSEFGLDAMGGYFVIDNLAVMAQLGFGSMKPAGGDAIGMSNFGIGARYYIGGNIPAGLMYSTQSLDGESLGSRISIGAGYLMMLTDNVALEPSFNYNMDSLEGEAVGSGMEIKIGLGIFM